MWPRGWRCAAGRYTRLAVGWFLQQQVLLLLLPLQVVALYNLWSCMRLLLLSPNRRLLLLLLLLCPNRLLLCPIRRLLLLLLATHGC